MSKVTNEELLIEILKLRNEIEVLKNKPKVVSILPQFPHVCPQRPIYPVQPMQPWYQSPTITWGSGIKAVNG